MKKIFAVFKLFFSQTFHFDDRSYDNGTFRRRSFFNFSEDKRGELIAVESRFGGFGDLLPSTDFSPSIEPAAEAMFCPATVRKPPNVKCRVSGKLTCTRPFLSILDVHKKSNVTNVRTDN